MTRKSILAGFFALVVLVGTYVSVAAFDAAPAQAGVAELVIIEPPAKFAAGAEALGFLVVQRRHLSNLGLRIIHVRAPVGESVDSAVDLLRGRFPGLVIDDYFMAPR